MSITGSLVGYEISNNVNVNKAKSTKKTRSLLNMTGGGAIKQCSASLNSSLTNSIITTATGSISNAKSKHQNTSNECKQHKNKRLIHLNSLWSIWYGIIGTTFQGYLVLLGTYRFLGCTFVQWRGGHLPFTELNMQIILCSLVLMILPLFLLTTLIKVGNLANDGIKLATGSGKCSAEPDDGLEEEAKGGTLKALWTHGGPTSAFIHIIMALCLLLPRLMLEARLIENGNLQRDHIWRTELDLFFNHKDRFVVLSFMTSPYQNLSSASFDNSLENGSPELIDDDNDRILYEKTHLIESFDSDFDDGESLFDTHERIEIEMQTTKSTIKTTMMPDAITTRTMTSSSQSMSSMTPIHQSSSTVKENLNNFNQNRKHERSKTGGGSRQSSSRDIGKNVNAGANTGMGGNGGRKHIGKHEHSQHRNGHRNPTNDSNNGPFDGDMEKVNRKDKNSNGSGRRIDDIDEKLELKPNAKFDFDRVYENTPVFDVSNNNNKPSAMKKVPKMDDRRSSNSPGTGHNNNSKKSKDSEIHIVKKERPIETVEHTPPLSADSKIIEIKPANRSGTGAQNSKRTKRLTPLRFVEDYTEIEHHEMNTLYVSSASSAPPSGIRASASPLVNAIPSNVTIPASTNEFIEYAKRLQSMLGIQNQKDYDINSLSHHPSLEFLNLLLAIIVWSARYPAVFWSTSKGFAIVFSLQLLANNLDIIFGYCGASVLYKIQIVGQQFSIPAPPLLLNAVVTISLFILSTTLIIASSLVLYLYGHGRLSTKIRDRCIISTKSDDSWTYFAHCASLCFILALAVVKAPLMHDLSASYRGSLDGTILISVLSSIVHLFLWIVLWLALTAKRKWNFKLPPLMVTSVQQPLLIGSLRHNGGVNGTGGGVINGISGASQRTTHTLTGNGNANEHADETIYWPKLTPSSPKLKVTFNDVPSTSSDHPMAEHDGKRNPGRRVSLCLSSTPGGEGDDGDYATLRGPINDLLHLNDLENHCDLADDTSEEGKLLACVRDDSVTYASTRDLEPPCTTATASILAASSIAASTILSDTSPGEIFIESPHHQILSPLAPVTVTVHTNESHILTSTPRCLRRADSGVPTDALLTPRSDTTSTESSTSPPDRALSETSSGVHSGEEREEVVIRPRPNKTVVKPPQPAIQEEPFGRSTNMKMTSFNNDGKSSATLPLTRGPTDLPRSDFVNHCSTMPLPIGCHQQQQIRSHTFTPTASKSQLHTTLPNGIRYANSHFLRRLPHIKNCESPYGILGLGAGHHTFSKLLHDPLLCHNISSIPEDRDSANFSMSSDHDRDLYVNSGQLH